MLVNAIAVLTRQLCELRGPTRTRGRDRRGKKL
jgi:hypothetical protein